MKLWDEKTTAPDAPKTVGNGRRGQEMLVKDTQKPRKTRTNSPHEKKQPKNTHRTRNAKKTNKENKLSY